MWFSIPSWSSDPYRDGHQRSLTRMWSRGEGGRYRAAAIGAACSRRSSVRPVSGNTSTDSRPAAISAAPSAASTARRPPTSPR